MVTMDDSIKLRQMQQTFAQMIDDILEDASKEALRRNDYLPIQALCSIMMERVRTIMIEIGGIDMMYANFMLSALGKEKCQETVLLNAAVDLHNMTKDIERGVNKNENKT